MCQFNQQIFNDLLSTYYAPHTILGTSDTLTNKADKNICPCGVCILVGQSDKRCFFFLNKDIKHLKN